MLKILLKKQLAEIFRSYFYDAKKNKARSKGAVIAYMVSFVVLMAGLLGGMFTALSVSLCTPLVSAGMGWLYFAIMGLIAVVLGVFGSVFNTYAGLYLAKDNDLLLSMPIPVGAIMASRILGVYIMGLMYSGIVIIPAAVVYMIQAASAAAEFIGPVLLAVLISVLVLTLSCALGWVVAQISKKLKNRSFITVIISLLFLGAYYFIYFRAQSVITDIIANAAEYGDKIRGAAYPVYIFGNAGAGDPVSMLILTAVVAVLFALMWMLISRSFIKIATATGSTGKKVPRAKRAGRKSVDSALLLKEFARFTSSPNYMLNCGLGTVLLPAFGIFLLIRGGEYAALFRQVFAGHSGFVPVILTSAVCAVASMNDISAPSVSLEGKNIWIAQSLPVTPWQIIRAKLGVHLLVTGIPAVFCMVCALIVGGFSAPEAVISFVFVLLFTVFSALAGMTAGLKMPNVHWTNETVPIKQSGPVFLTLFGVFIYAAAFAGVYFAVKGFMSGAAYLAASAAVTAVLSLVMYLWIRNSGTRIFASL